MCSREDAREDERLHQIPVYDHTPLSASLRAEIPKLTPLDFSRQRTDLPILKLVGPEKLMVSCMDILFPHVKFELVLCSRSNHQWLHSKILELCVMTR